MYVFTDSEKVKSIALKKGAHTISKPPELVTKQALGGNAHVHGLKYIRDTDEKATRF